MPDGDWPFDQTPDTGCFTLRSIVFGGAPILRVSHDGDGHDWQFLGLGDPNEADACIVGLGEMVRLDVTLLELAKLPAGWHAWRESTSSPWQASPVPHRDE